MVRLNFLHISFGKVKGIGFPHLCPCSKRSLPGCLRSKLRHQTNGNHLQSSGSAGAGIAFLIFQRSCGLFQNFNGVMKAIINICFHSGIGLLLFPEFSQLSTSTAVTLVLVLPKSTNKTGFIIYRLTLSVFCFRCFHAKVFIQGRNGSFRRCTRTKNPVKAHCLEAFLYFIKRLFSNNDITAYIQKNIF